MARILLVEDHPLNRELTSDLLELCGHHVTTAGSGEEGLGVAREQRPDLILLDLSLPGMDGLEVARQLKADPNLNKIPVVAVTAHATRDDERKALEVGCLGYLSKPFDPVTFVSTVTSFITTT